MPSLTSVVQTRHTRQHERCIWRLGEASILPLKPILTLQIPNREVQLLAFGKLVVPIGRASDTNKMLSSWM